MDLTKRIEEFNKELEPLLKKYELGFGGEPLITAQGTLGARAVLVDLHKEEEKK